MRWCVFNIITIFQSPRHRCPQSISFCISPRKTRMNIASTMHSIHANNFHNIHPSVEIMKYSFQFASQLLSTMLLLRSFSLHALTVFATNCVHQIQFQQYIFDRGTLKRNVNILADYASWSRPYSFISFVLKSILPKRNDHSNDKYKSRVSFSLERII